MSNFASGKIWVFPTTSRTVETAITASQRMITEQNFVGVGKGMNEKYVIGISNDNIISFVYDGYLFKVTKDSNAPWDGNVYVKTAYDNGGNLKTDSEGNFDGIDYFTEYASDRLHIWNGSGIPDDGKIMFAQDRIPIPDINCGTI